MMVVNLFKGDTQLIIKECQSRGLNLWEVAYILATTFHETAATMKPIREYGSETYLKSKKYYPYVGMGYVQLTWDYNYKKASKYLGVDFMKNPKLLLEPKYAVRILVQGMLQGWFTGKSLKDYIDGIDEDDKEDLREFSNARCIVNGTDKQVEIGKIALQYELALKASYKPAQPLPDDPGVQVPLKPKRSVWAILGDLIMKLIRGKK